MTIDDYWGVSLVELTKPGAKKVLKFAESIGFDGYVVDPRFFYTRDFDRGSVEIVLRFMRAGLVAYKDQPLENRERWGAESLIDDMEEWLEKAADVTYD